MRGGVEPTRLDPTRLDLGPEPVSARRGGLRGPLGSLLLHLLPLLVLMTWLRPPLEIPAPIPVQLVIEQPPPPPPAPVPAEPKPRATPPPGRLASDDFGKVGQAKGPKSPETEHPEQSKPPSSGTEKPAAPASGERGTAEQQEQTAEPTKAAALVAPPVIDPPPPLALSVERIAPPPPPTPAAPKPAAPKPTAAERPRTLTGLVLPLPLRADSANAGAASSRYPGPDATRDEYCAYALYLVLKHLDLLPDSLVGARRGETVLTIRLRDDGAILGTAVAESSGYLDIDDQAVRMVNAVGKFPPLPAWVPGRTADFRFRLHFPHAAAR